MKNYLVFTLRYVLATSLYGLVGKYILQEDLNVAASVAFSMGWTLFLTLNDMRGRYENKNN